jgi:S-adenosylmethionine:tRNA ribosyltransferase-isomerase
VKPARRAPERRDAVGLVVLDSVSGASELASFSELAGLLDAGDLVVVNDAATFPGSIAARTVDGDPVELRLVEERPGGTFLAVAFGAGDWRIPTESRPPPPPLAAGDRLEAGGGALAEVIAIDARSPRLLELRFAGDPWAAIYGLGRPIQYSYLAGDLDLWSVQTIYASRPVAAEMPSAGRPLTWQLLIDLRRRGIALARLTHAAGLSSTGDADLDARLPLPEGYDIPEATAAAVARARSEGQRIVAVGSTVVRALESAARAGGGAVRSGSGRAELTIEPATPLRVVDTLLTGLHEPGVSHHRMLQAFAPRGALDRAWARAEAGGLRRHELGDLALIGPDLLEPRARPRRRVAERVTLAATCSWCS